jgi:enoyl-[acyl-carrier protein] reductase I
MSLTRRLARKLPSAPDVLELDVTNPAHVAALAEELGRRWGSIDGVLHAIARAPESCLGQGILEAGWSDVAIALEVSAYSLKALAQGLLPLFEAAGGGSVVALDFDASVAWPAYDWMGVAKAALESLARYLARDLGPSRVRVNLVAAGPVKTLAARSIPGFAQFEDVWRERAPLGWDVHDGGAVARACVGLLSDWFPMTTGEIVHVDGGYHAVGA